MQWTAKGATRRRSFALCLKSGVLLGLLAGVLASASQEAQAQAFIDFPFYSSPRKRSYHYAPRKRSAPERSAPSDKAAPETPGPLFALISIADQKVVFYGSEGVAAQSAISTGRRGHPTPTGVFSIVQKKRFHVSNIYSDAPMPFMQRITWSGIALHAGVLPGYPASHGCIRMPSGFAQRIFSQTRMGQRVIISPNTVTPAPIAHKNLPVPTFVASEEPLQAKDIPASPEASAPKLEVVADNAPRAEGGAMIAQNAPGPQEGALANVTLTAAAAEPRRLNPEEVAQEMKRDANEKARSAARASKAAQLMSMKRATEARLAARKLASADTALERARDKLAAANRKAEKADGEEDIAKANEAKTAAEEAVAEAQKVFDEASAARDIAQQELAAARRMAEEAKAAGKQASATLAEANRRLKPLSVFISKKAGRLYVRQDFEKLFDVPVTISAPERPIGTHVYFSTKAAEDGASLSWVAVSMPPEAPDTKRASEARTARETTAREAKDEPAVTAALPPAPPETAPGALDRIAIPEDAARRIAELSWVGASIIVSDHPISGETGDTTDFIILTKSRVAAQ